MPTPPMTEDEIVSYLKRTTLPTLLVEGSTDAKIFRWLESETGIESGAVLPCSGRKTLFSIFRRRHEFPRGKFAWLADLDMDRFASPPPETAGIIFTAGYSIENDIYAGSEIESLLDPIERKKHQQLLDVLGRWFAFEVMEFQAERHYKVDVSPYSLIDLDSIELSHSFREKRGYVEPSREDLDRLIKDIRLDLRGKNLIKALVCFLSAPKREMKYGEDKVIDLCLKLYGNTTYIKRLVQEIRRSLA